MASQKAAQSSQNDYTGALVTSQRVLARSNRNLVQSAATQTVAASSLSQHGRPGDLLKDFIAYYNQAAKPINWTYTIDKLAQKLG